MLEEKNPALAFSLQFRNESRSYPPLEKIKKSECLFLHGASSEAVQRLRPHCDLLCVLDDVWSPFFDELDPQFLQDPGVEFYDTKSENDWLTLSWRTLFKKWDLVDLKDESIRELLERYKSGVEMSLNDFKDYGLSHYQHMIANWEKETFTLRGSKDALKGETAILCGAGPSLGQNIDALRDAPGHIFAGGRALEILYKENIPIDFAGVLDPTFYHPDIDKWVANCKALFYQDRALPQMVKGKRVWCGVGEGYPLLDWFYKEMGILHRIDPGWNVLNFLTSVALYLGCDPIVFVGQDLKYVDKKKYAIDVEHQENMNLVGDSKPDFKMAAEWVRSQKLNLGNLQSIKPFKKSEVKFDRVDVKPNRVKLEMSLQNANEKIENGLKELENIKGFNPLFTLYEVELKEEACYSSLLRPLWQLYQGSFGFVGGMSEAQPFDKKQVHAKVCEFTFYKRVVKSYGIFV